MAWDSVASKPNKIAENVGHIGPIEDNFWQYRASPEILGIIGLCREYRATGRPHVRVHLEGSHMWKPI